MFFIYKFNVSDRVTLVKEIRNMKFRKQSYVNRPH